MKEILTHLYQHKTLTRDQAKSILLRMGKGDFNGSQKAAFLGVFSMRPITLEELSGFREAMLELQITVATNGFLTIDLCGTGGDGKDTFNISTLSSFVAAGAGLKVAKHGNYAVSSSVGSSNILEYFGYKFSSDTDKLMHELEEAGIMFLHAPLFNPAMKNIAPIRKELGTKTFFNILGPMINPANPDRQLIGVFNTETARLYHYIYQQTDKNYTVVHSLDGYDEVSLTGTFKKFSREGEANMTPDSLGMAYLKPEEIVSGGTLEESADIFLNVLKNEATKAQKEVVIANSALAVQTAGLANEIIDCVAIARESIESGAALQSFKKLMDYNKQL
ncbi:MAG: anthranilate phosphoribosyltransferase [Salinivirgaceae bacterium]|nr:MAG: anthranilate phosphoribosyltransferase [Salinivirgaceae bacterium]